MTVYRLTIQTPGLTWPRLRWRFTEDAARQMFRGEKRDNPTSTLILARIEDGREREIARWRP